MACRKVEVKRSWLVPEHDTFDQNLVRQPSSADLHHEVVLDAGTGAVESGCGAGPERDGRHAIQVERDTRARSSQVRYGAPEVDGVISVVRVRVRVIVRVRIVIVVIAPGLAAFGLDANAVVGEPDRDVDQIRGLDTSHRERGVESCAFEIELHIAGRDAGQLEPSVAIDGGSDARPDDRYGDR